MDYPSLLQYPQRLKTLLLPALLLLSGCFVGDENDWASRDQIVQAASRCGITDFEPQQVGGAFTAYVPATVPAAKDKEDCIYRDLARHGLLATR
jgi:hypothetical protein